NAVSLLPEEFDRCLADPSGGTRYECHRSGRCHYPTCQATYFSVASALLSAHHCGSWSVRVPRSSPITSPMNGLKSFWLSVYLMVERSTSRRTGVVPPSSA